jgi:hypothetical protein
LGVGLFLSITVFKGSNVLDVEISPWYAVFKILGIAGSLMIRFGFPWSATGGGELYE